MWNIFRVVAVVLAVGVAACGADDVAMQALANQSQALPEDGCYPNCWTEVGDEDWDGFDDASDACPYLPETMNGYADDDGCPDAAISEFDGAWRGQVNTIVGSAPPTHIYGHSVSITASPSTNTASVVGMCHAGYAAMLMWWAANELHWEGSLTCEPAVIDGCMTEVRYSSARAFVTEGGALVIEASGLATQTSNDGACVASQAPIYVSFLGTRQ